MSHRRELATEAARQHVAKASEKFDWEGVELTDVIRDPLGWLLILSNYGSVLMREDLSEVDWLSGSIDATGVRVVHPGLEGAVSWSDGST